MTLAAHTYVFLKWLRRATRRLFRLSRFATTVLIAAVIGSQLATVLALLLPLKVILLVGSDGVPSYFRFFISEEQKDLWVMILAASTFALLILSKYLDSVTARYSKVGAELVVRAADQAPIATNESEIAETNYYKIGETTAKILFGTLALLAGLALFPSLFLAIIVLLCVQFFSASKLLGRLDSSPTSRIGRYLKEDTAESLKFIRNANFLLAFAFLLSAFVFFDDANRLIAIASILLSRQIFGSLGDAVKNSVKLSTDRSRVDALLFASQRYEAFSLDGTSSQFQELFSRAARLNRLRTLYADTAIKGPHLTTGNRNDLNTVTESVWVDSASQRVNIFDLYGFDGYGSGDRRYREYVYTANAATALRNHDYLLDHLGTEELRTLRPVASYEVDGYVGRIVEYRNFVAVQRRSWRSVRSGLLGHFWGLELPDSLVESYMSAHVQLHERCNDALLSRLWLAADEAWAESTYCSLLEQIGSIRDRVSMLPMALYNSRFLAQNVVYSPEEGVRIIDWSSWSLEPVGAGYDPQRDGADLLCRATAKIDPDGSPTGTPLSNCLCAAMLHRVEDQTRRGRPKEALRVIHYMLPLVFSADDRILSGLNAYVGTRSSESSTYETLQRFGYDGIFTE